MGTLREHFWSICETVRQVRTQSKGLKVEDTRKKGKMVTIKEFATQNEHKQFQSENFAIKKFPRGWVKQSIFAKRLLRCYLYIKKIQ